MLKGRGSVHDALQECTPETNLHPKIANLVNRVSMQHFKGKQFVLVV
jgi:hypothetical protein